MFTIERTTNAYNQRRHSQIWHPEVEDHPVAHVFQAGDGRWGIAIHPEWGSCWEEHQSVTDMGRRQCEQWLLRNLPRLKTEDPDV